jgi:multiple sugar transport system substrate-binding protein
MFYLANMNKGENAMKSEEHKKLYEVNRRQFLKIAGASGLALSAGGLFGSILPAHAAVAGKDCEERAINAVKALKSKMKGDTLTLMVPSGAEGCFTESMPWWTEATGIKVDVVVVPLPELGTKAMNVAVTRSQKFDVFVLHPVDMPDLVEANLLLDITDDAKKYDPEFGGPNGYIPPLATLAMYKGRLRGLFVDGDANNLSIRRDWLADSDNQKAFEDKYGYKLKPPVLFDEMFDQIKFFTNKEKGTYGAWLYLSPFYAKWTFLQYLISQGVLPFDKDMHPQIATPEGVKAMEEMIALKPYIHPGSTTGTWSECWHAYGAGNIWLCINWSAFTKYINMPKDKGGFSDIPGKVMTCKVPGRKLKDGTLLRPCRLTIAHMYAVSRFSKNQEIAYLYCQWMNSPRISAKIIPVKGGYIDPYRYNHLTKEVLLGYGPYWEEFKDAITFNTKHSYPELIIRGGQEYETRLDENVIAAFQGMKKPETALKEVEEKWEEITERYGREEQKKAWNFVTCTMFGEDLRKAMNLGNPPPIVEELLGS